MTRILVAGGTGFVGRHLVRRLAAPEHGHGDEVTVMTRRTDASAPDTGPDASGTVRMVTADVGDPAGLAVALADVEVAYYLVHSLQRARYADLDREAADNFGRAAAEAGVRRVVYLGGLGRDGDELSDHLRSRREVEEVLSAHLDTVALRASIVVGQGGISWEILCQLVERLPAMVTPRWVDTPTQPIALADTLEYLVGAADPAIPAGHYDIGAPEPTTYREMMRLVADLMRRPLVILPIPLLTPRLSARWVRWVTDVDTATAEALIDSLGTPAAVTERRLEELTGHRAMPFADAAAAALHERIGRARANLVA